MANCGCGSSETVLRFVNPDGSFTYPPVIDGTVTIPSPTAETPLIVAAESGIKVAQSGVADHTVGIAVKLAPDSPVPLGFDNSGRITAGPVPTSPIWTSPNVDAQGGVRVLPGGVQGHSPTFALHLDPESPVALSVGPDGLRAEFDTPAAFTCSALSTCSINALGDVAIVNATEDSVLAVNAVGQIVDADLCAIWARCITGDDEATPPAAPVGAGPFVLQFDPTTHAMTWVTP